MCIPIIHILYFQVHGPVEHDPNAANASLIWFASIEVPT